MAAKVYSQFTQRNAQKQSGSARPATGVKGSVPSAKEKVAGWGGLPGKANAATWGKGMYKCPKYPKSEGL
jgi:hypothetical protein